MAEEIELEILWTDSAKISFGKIVDYLQKAWTDREVEKFVNRTDEWLSTLKLYPEMCRPSTKRKNTRIGIQLIFSMKLNEKKHYPLSDIFSFRFSWKNYENCF